MNAKRKARVRRAKPSRMKMRELGVHRLSVYRTPRHMYAQIISPEGDQVIASASTLDKSFEEAKTGNANAATLVGTVIAERAKAAGITRVAFDRSGFKYHGRIKALADAARAAGLDF